MKLLKDTKNKLTKFKAEMALLTKKFDLNPFDSDDEEDKPPLQILQEAEQAYNESKYKKWLVSALFFCIGVLIGYAIPYVLAKL